MSESIVAWRQHRLTRSDTRAASIASFPETNPGAAELHTRQLEEADLPAIEQHLLNLRPADRRSRFLAELSDSAITAYVRQLGFNEVALFGAFESDGRLVGLAEAFPIPGHDAVEVSVSMDPAFRRQGLGRHLVTRLFALMFASGTRSAEFIFDPCNGAIARLVRGLGGRSSGEPGHVTISRDSEFVPLAAT